MKRVILLLIVIALTVGLLAGCGGNDQTASNGSSTDALSSVSGAGSSVTGSSGDATSSDQTPSDIISGDRPSENPEHGTVYGINGYPMDEFKVVWQHANASYIVKLQIDELAKAIEDKYLCTPEYCDTDTSHEYEIFVGITREGMVVVNDPNTYAINISDKKVYLYGGSIRATAMAVSEFARMLQKGGVSDADSMTGKYSEAIGGYDLSKYYTYAWGDDFNGNAIDTSKWYVSPEGKFDSTGMNGRESIRTDDPNYVFVSGGKFHIRAGYTKDKYIGGLLMSHRHMIYKYGYLEMSALLPHGDGFWTALWLDTRGHTFWPPPEQATGKLFGAEIDVNECFGNSATIAANVHKWPTEQGTKEGYSHTSLDTPQYGNDKKHSLESGNTFGEGFHTFGLLWDEDEHTFTCDGEVYFTYKNNTTPEDRDGLHQLSFIRLSMATGFASLGRVAADNDPAWKTSNELAVDYVHVYQLQDGKQILLTQ